MKKKNIRKVVSSKKSLLTTILLIFSLICLIVCKSNSDSNRKIISHEVIGSDSLGYVRDMVICNDYLVLLDVKPLNRMKNQLRVYDLKNFNFLYSTGKVGSGPGEFLQGMSLNKIAYGKGGFSLLDLSYKKVIIFQPDNSGRLTYSKAIQLKEGRAYMPVIVNDSTIFSLGLELFSGRFAVYNSLGNMIETLGELPPGKEKDTPVPVHQQACKGLMRMTPDGEKLVVSYQFAELIDIYNTEGVLLRRITGRIGMPKYRPIVRNGYPTFIINEETILGYLDIEVTNKYIIALFSGESASTAQYESDKIRVYTLVDGDLIKTNVLDTKISQIEIDVVNNRLLAVSYFPFPKVYSFDLQKMLY
ncbi:BF3164 family lipoprotein [Melioribacteraceae bacterium 4301-Me]|uniref:BF3164 family lipoprotein n=1 Tax=Pyranulibacter aquaticus TaxID=3163344 RepID=UPI003597F680